MEEQENKLDQFVKRLEKADYSLLVIGFVLLIIPVVALYFLAGGSEGGKKMSQQRMRNMVQRKNVFNFGSKSEKGGAPSAPRSGSSGSSGWFTSAKTEEQTIQDELSQAMNDVERSLMEVQVPPDLYGDARDMYVAEHNYYLCMANGAMEDGDADKALEYIQKALDDARDNVFLTAYALASLCSLYEQLGDKKALEDAYKKFAEAVGKLPKEFGGGDLKSIMRNQYQNLQALKDADASKISEALSADKLIKSGAISGSPNIKNVYADFPIKYK